MEVEFGDRDLERCYAARAEAARRWGSVVGRKYGRLVDALYNALDRQELGAIRSLRLHPLKGSRDGEWAIDLHDRWRVILSFEGETVRIREVTQHYGD